MRITNQQAFDQIRNSMQNSRGKIDTFQRQSSSMKKVNTPSDAPADSSKILEIRTDKVNNEQFLSNVHLANAFLNNSDSALDTMSGIVLRAKEIAIGQSSGASSNEGTRFAVAEEVKQLYEQAIAAANTRIADRYIFGGYKTDRAPVDVDGKYRGDDGQMMVEIARDVFVSMNVPGLSVFNTNPRTSEDGRRVYGTEREQQRAPAANREEEARFSKGEENVNVFDELQNLRIALLSGDLTNIRETLERFDQLHSKIVATRAQIGSRASGLSGTIQSVERQNLTNAQLQSEIEDADMAQVMTDLAKEEQVFRTVLETSKRMIQPTLLDFIH